MTIAYPVVFLPGLLCDRACWASQLVSLRGAAECSVADYGSLDSLGAMADAVLAQVHGDLVVVGHSMGGRVALEICRRAPARVRGLALLDSGYQARSHDEAGERERAGRMQLVELARVEGMRAMGRQWVRPMVHPERLHDAPLIDGILDMIERKTIDVFEAQQRALLARPDATDHLTEIACSTLLMCGREDAWSPPPRHQEMASRIRDSELVIVERCGHMAPMERPAEVNAVLGRWLSASAGTAC
jgi:pimeloyl-ACP methyl ester carboxylesterase